VSDDIVTRAAEVIERSLFREVNGGELEPIWQIYKPGGVALVIRQALADANLLAAPLPDDVQAVLDAAVALRPYVPVIRSLNAGRHARVLGAAVDRYLTNQENPETPK
jgi:hypothetical protein